MPCVPESTASSVQVQGRSTELRGELYRAASFSSSSSTTTTTSSSRSSSRSYLVNNRYQLQDTRNGTSSARQTASIMAATAKHELSSRRKFPAADAGDEDIAAIAKQISDHAEAIYQTWKSQGLAPTEILNCHSNASAADKFGTVLTPTNSVAGNKFVANKKQQQQLPASPVDILTQDNNNQLEKLVNNFVVEDKARIAASRQRSPSKNLPSSIQFALQKFEQNSSSSTSSPTQPKTPTSFASPVRPQVKTPPGHHNDIFLESIDSPSKIVVQQKVRPTALITNHQITSPTNQACDVSGTNSSLGSLSTWPLKNKIVNDSRKPAGIQIIRSPTQESNNSHSNCLDELAREEERLINALKTGAVITEEPVERIIPVVASQQQQPKQKPVIVRETKPKVDPVKPILMSPSQVSALNSTALVNSIAHQQQQQQQQQQLITSPTTSNEVKSSSLSKDDLSSMSAVDYAKVRYRAAQQNCSSQQRLEEQKLSQNATFNSSEPIVSTTRSKFEPTAIDKDSSDKGSKDDKDFIASRWGLRLNSSRPRPVEPVPHPELTTQQKQHIRAAAATGATGNNPVRPFLTRGSVAERVLIFEKCPSELLLDKRGSRQPAINTWRSTAGQEVNNKAQTYVRDKVVPPKSLPPHTTLQRHVKANRNVHIPRFYFPGGKPTPLSQAEATISRITAAFHSLPGHRASRSQFHTITKACDLPLYWKVPLFLASGGDTNGIIEMSEFLDFWKELSTEHHDAASKFVRTVTRGLRTSILPEDLIPMVQDVVETHPGLTFLKEATEFHSRYVHTVIARIFYCVNRSWSGKISVSELRRSNLLSVIGILEHKEDINQVTAYFSYEHFYVIYCKFWELDRDHDLFIDKSDLMRHNDHALSTRMIERIFSGAVTRGVKGATGVHHPENKMSYTEFVWFLLSEEDKNHPTAIEYWFRCMDLDGDGYISMYELEYFYEEQLSRMETIGIETLPFEDCLCQMLDMIKPSIPGKISLSDLKKCKMTSIFFDTFFNLEKYLDHEQRDPFASARDHDADGHELSDWDRFAAEEYELLVAEESGNDGNDQSIYDSCAEDVYSPNLDVLIGESVDHNGMSHHHQLHHHQGDARVGSSGSNNAYHRDDVSSSSSSSSKRANKNSHYDSCDSDDYADSDN